ncbi:MAG TPA: TIGR03435 family protein, partial [Bryobacteraceae bacterium]|nr:TIGR03435 family protein [Bryobacteraceae bacterium]
FRTPDPRGHARVGRPVIDKTGLNGTYDYVLQASETSTDLESPSIFTAVQDQLGLRLEPAKAPIEVWVVDSVERPSAN